MKATEQYSPVVLLMLYKVDLNFEFRESQKRSCSVKSY